VNGPYNYIGDGDTGEWLTVLEKARALDPLVVAPGHGPAGDASLLEDQAAFFRELRRAVKAASEGRTPEQVQASVEALRAELAGIPGIGRYVGKASSAWDSFPPQVGKVYTELTGRSFPDRKAEVEAEGLHAWLHHGRGGD
jgi:glyoxylase-like metal-dependent hydrolase (beta-lactamase superfamily II)